jgi:hypothetical protein
MEQNNREKLFQQAVEEAWERHELGTYGHAEDVTKVERTTLLRMRTKGIIPSRGKVIEWAEGIEENINKWLILAGYVPLRIGSVVDTRGLSPKALAQICKLVGLTEEAHSNDHTHD